MKKNFFTGFKPKIIIFIFIIFLRQIKFSWIVSFRWVYLLCKQSCPSQIRGAPPQIMIKKLRNAIDNKMPDILCEKKSFIRLN